MSGDNLQGDQSLSDTLSSIKEKIKGEDFFRNQVPMFVPENLNSRISLRPYQQEAIGRFNYLLDEEDALTGEKKHRRSLFRMATGSGKTVIMAALILLLYRDGYRRFLFFVNRDNIIHQTRSVFLNPSSSKCLFHDNIWISNSRVSIREVDTFRNIDSSSINIHFSTVQGLHGVLNHPKENSLTYEELEDLDVVLISDEAHHINVETQSSARQANLYQTNWEQTVDRIFRSSRKNLLLEFTATLDFSQPALREKYKDSLIFDYPLKDFRLEGYSKEVKVFESNASHYQRALHAIMLSQFRRKIFEKYGLLVKPVVLFKSKTIAESEQFFCQFAQETSRLNRRAIEEALERNRANPDFMQLSDYLSKNAIDLENFAIELTEDFAEHKCISINSKSESEQRQIAINTLEDEDNEYRAVFAVDKLNEGWDVLNLFDIVRLYDTRDARQGRPGKTTISEAQLIGRGARYFSFKIDDSQSMHHRKYDSAISEDELNLQLCEVLYYHSTHNVKYIQELKTALIESGILPSKSEQKELTIKPEIKQSRFFKYGYIYLNERKSSSRENVVGIDEDFLAQCRRIKLPINYTRSTLIFEDFGSTFADTNIKLDVKQTRLSDIDQHVIRKAMHRVPSFRFNRLKKWYPRLESVTEFITSEKYLGNVCIEVEGNQARLASLSRDDKLYIAIKFLEELGNQLSDNTFDYCGTHEFKPKGIEYIFSDKVLNFGIEGETQEKGRGQQDACNLDLRIDLSQREWYVFNDCFGTSEEKHFVKFMDEMVPKLRSRYKYIYLFRNEKHLGIYNFKDGRKFEPDFVLFLMNDDNDTGIQLFIEPKGGHLIETDRWKEDLLVQLEKTHKIPSLKSNRFLIYGLPFYCRSNDQQNQKFKSSFEASLLR